MAKIFAIFCMKSLSRESQFIIWVIIFQIEFAYLLFPFGVTLPRKPSVHCFKDCLPEFCFSSFWVLYTGINNTMYVSGKWLILVRLFCLCSNSDLGEKLIFHCFILFCKLSFYCLLPKRFLKKRKKKTLLFGFLII